MPLNLTTLLQEIDELKADVADLVGKSSEREDELSRYDPHFELRGGNKTGYESHEDEQLLAGPAGTGKSLTNLLRCYRTARDYPGARILIVRKTRESLTESVLVTWERDILGPTHPILTRRPVIRRVRQSYTFPNRSEVVVGGIDKPGKILSSEYDLIYVPEATDLELEDWETLGGRLRAARVPYQQIIADCNPTTPHHWLYKRFQAGSLNLIPTTHKDNPRYWDGEDWTPLGKQYLARLGRMTGNRRERFLLGKWVAAEGVVYSFDPEIHQLPLGWEPPKTWPRVWGVDWGESSPTALGMFAVDPQGRMYHYREVYQTHLRADKLGEWAKAEVDSGREPVPHGIVCDHDPDKKADFERTSKLHLTMAEKADRLEGIQAMQERFDVQDDGKPRIFLKPNALAHEPDRLLVEKGEPTDSVSEVVAYCFVAGTQIRTSRGTEPIEQVRIGSLVHTRSGLKRVVEAGMTQSSARVYSALFSNGATLTGTGEHPIFVRDFGWKSLSSISSHDIVEVWKKPASSSTAFRTVDTQMRSGGRIGSTSELLRSIGQKDLLDCTSIYGGLFTGRFPKDSTFTTSTGIRSTTSLKTWRASLRDSTSMLTETIQSGKLLSGRRSSMLHEFWRLSGLRIQRGTQYDPNEAEILGRIGNQRIASASSAEPCFRAGALDELGSVLERVTQTGDAPTRPTTKRGRARSAGSLSRPHDGQRRFVAPVYAVSVTEEKEPATVFNLTVEECHEYYANDILVHNCWDEDFLADEPIEGRDHWCDQARYCVRYCNANFPGPHSTALAESYSRAKPVPKGIDRITRLPKGVFG